MEPSPVKNEIRERIWKEMKEKKIERFPYAWGRIPNFQGAEKAASRLKDLGEFKNAQTVFVAPDSPQRPVRELVLRNGKVLIMPTPRLTSGFVMVTPVKGRERESSTIQGAFKFGRIVSAADVPEVDFVIQGAVAVDILGGRLGKGGGYGDREIGILKEHRKGSKVLIAVTVHDVQITEELPQDLWDFTVDIIVTPSKVIKTSESRKEAISTYMSYILRHHPPESMSKEGFITLDELVDLVRKKYHVDESIILTTVEEDSKGRFQVQENRIRAVYGHSVPVSIEHPPADIDILYHGTYERAAQKILKEGLKPGKRQKVHLSPTVEVAEEVGKRRCEHPIILKIDVRKALKDKITIEKASDLVYVADFIPPEYISRIGE